MLRARPAGALRQLAAANTSRHAPSSQRNFGASVAPVETVAEPSFFRGVWPIMATPFKKRADEPIDFTGFVKAVRRHAQFHLDLPSVSRLSFPATWIPPARVRALRSSAGARLHLFRLPVCAILFALSDVCCSPGAIHGGRGRRRRHHHGSARRIE